MEELSDDGKKKKSVKVRRTSRVKRLLFMRVGSLACGMHEKTSFHETSSLACGMHEKTRP
jgi:hypothetical protein